MSKYGAGRSSQNFNPTKKSNKNRKTKTQAIFKSREKPKYRSGAKPNNRSRDRGDSPSKRRFPSGSKGKTNYRSGKYGDRKRGQSDKGAIEFHTVICAKCKKETQVPFKPTGVKPVYCRECFQIENPKTDSPSVRSSSGRSNYRSSDRSSGRYDNSNRRVSVRGSSELYTVTCAKCNEETQIPFKPTGSKPVYCRKCFQEQKKLDVFSADKPKRNFSDNKRRSSSTRHVRQKDERLEAKPAKSSFEEKDETVERFGDRTGPYRSSKKMHKTECRTCKKEIIIPFKPSPNKPIYCPDCYQKEGIKKKTQ
ncbi:MAG: CxxC-x17-CxxC domain-containing protein [Candidatus Heimdallarchaeaceae archaeon]